MIMDLIIQESKINLQRQAQLKSELFSLPRGSVKERKVGKKTYFYLAYRENQKVVNKYVGDSQDEAEKYRQLVKTRKELEFELKLLKDEWKIYNKIGVPTAGVELRDIITESAAGRDFSLAFRSFLDVFYSKSDEKKEMVLLINREPERIIDVPDYQYAMCAATAHKLANDYSLTVPKWVWKKEYYLEKMYFGGAGKGKLRMYNMLYSPPEFKHRNIFVDENILMRV